MGKCKTYGFCDLNISVDDLHLKDTIIKGLKLGYETFAINKTISDEKQIPKANKKGSNKDILIPPPQIVEISDEDLRKHKLYKKPKILSRLTIKYSDHSSPFLHKAKDAISKYDIIAFAPTTDDAFKQLCQSNIEMDIITFDYEEMKYWPAKKMLKLAVKNDIYFEIPYAPCIRSSVQRCRIIQHAHDLFRISRSLNIIISSGASNANELRNPYDVANLALLFGLTPAAAKGALSFITYDLLYCANMRRTGASKCSAEFCSLENRSKRGKFSSLVELETFIDKYK